jgi:radical SAM superfamily enzyme YgiQ (UPF0313 family)
MKILLVQPPVRDFYQTRIRTQPIGLAYLAASLRVEGFETSILDCQTGRQTSLSLPNQFAHLKEIYPPDDQGPFRLYSGFYHFGKGWDEIRREIEEVAPDAVGISSLFTPYHGEALKVAEIVKQGDPSRMVVMGGPHPTADPEGVLKSPVVDVVVLGEGEIRFPRLLKAVRDQRPISGMEGIGFRDRGKIRINPVEGFIADIDSIPWPERHLLDPDRSRMGSRRSTMLITSRGCPHQCAYCSARLVMGNRFRPRDPEKVIAEMTACQREHGITSFDIEDDNFTFDCSRAKRLMELIIDRFGERTLTLSAMNGVSFAALDPDLLRLMGRAGFGTVNLSFVSTDPGTRKRMKRPGAAGPAYFDEMVASALEAGLTTTAYAILGMPGQTLSEMMDTLIYLMGRRVLIGPSIYYPSPGTPLMKHCQDKGLLPPDMAQWRSSAFPVETDAFDRLDLVTLFRITRLINFVKGEMRDRDISEGASWSDLYVLCRDAVQTTPVSWPHLVRLLFEERSFFGLVKGPGRTYCVKKIPTSRRVMDRFLDKAMDRPILRA